MGYNRFYNPRLYYPALFKLSLLGQLFRLGKISGITSYKQQFYRSDHGPLASARPGPARLEGFGGPVQVDLVFTETFLQNLIVTHILVSILFLQQFHLGRGLLTLRQYQAQSLYARCCFTTFLPPIPQHDSHRSNQPVLGFGYFLVL